MSVEGVAQTTQPCAERWRQIMTHFHSVWAVCQEVLDPLTDVGKESTDQEFTHWVLDLDEQKPPK